MRVAFAEEAELDLEAIGDFIARDNPRRALSFLAELRARCESLADFPARFPSVRHQASQSVHRCLHGNYLIFYQIEGDAVTILHIRHGASDYEGLFGPN